MPRLPLWETWDSVPLRASGTVSRTHLRIVLLKEWRSLTTNFHLAWVEGGSWAIHSSCRESPQAESCLLAGGSHWPLWDSRGYGLLLQKPTNVNPMLMPRVACAWGVSNILWKFFHASLLCQITFYLTILVFRKLFTKMKRFVFFNKRTWNLI